MRKLSLFALLTRHEVNQRHACIKYLGLGLRQFPLGPIPTARFKEQTVGVDPVIWLHRELLFLGIEKVEGQCIDGDLILSRKVLGGSSGKGLGKVDAAEPKHHRGTVVHPLLEELQPFHQVVDIASQRLQRWIGMLEPHSWSFSIKNLEEGGLQICTHQQQTFHGLLNIFQGLLNRLQEAVESLQFLRQDSVHALFIEGGILLLHLCHVPGFRQSAQYILGDFADHHVGRGAARRTAGARSEQELSHHVVCLAHFLGKVGVFVKAKDARRRHQGQVADVFQMLLVASLGRRHIGGAILLLVQDEVICQGFLAVVALQQSGQEPSVHGFCDSATIVALARQIVQCLDGRLIGIFVQEHLQLPHRDAKVVLGELIGDVPSQRAKEASFLDHRMEEAQVEAQAFESSVASAGVEELLVADGVHVVGPCHVGPQALGCFIGHLDPILQDRHGKLVGRIRSEPQAEVLVNLLGVFLIQQAFQARHPARGQVAVLKQDPASVLGGNVHEPFSLGTLTLSQRNAGDFTVFLCSKAVEVAPGICARREDEDQR
mmetsp:Transcript_82996/g.169159  ORF Transcript_82996/g.169159 Transcript_82996/m.169159 type:complete len:545 (-) Transcript_82996:1107-2741(-)